MSEAEKQAAKILEAMYARGMNAKEFAAELAAAEERGRRSVFADPEALARRFHETYERLAPEYGYETRKESAVPWEKVPEKNRRLMIAVCAALGGDNESGRRRGVEERDELRAALSRLLEALCIADSDVRTREVRAAVANGQAALAPRDSAPVCDCEATLWGGGHIASCAAYPRGAPRDSGKEG